MPLATPSPTYTPHPNEWRPGYRWDCWLSMWIRLDPPATDEPEDDDDGYEQQLRDMKNSEL